MKSIVSGLFLMLCGCAGIPEGVKAVDGFEIDRYLGIWYEIARLDHFFERGLSRVSATYTRGENGAVQVVNRGYDQAAGEWKEARGTAYFVETPDVGRLKVSFFWPFYGGYNIIALDKKAYRHALVCASNRSYLWILSREKHMEKSVLDGLLSTAEGLDFDVDQLIFVEQ